MTVFRSKDEVFSELLSGIVNGGATVSVNPGIGSPTSGYAVGQKGFEFVADLENEGLADEFNHWFVDAFNRAGAPGYYLGVWRDNETDLIYFDLTKVYVEKAAALEDAKSSGQIAVWDLNTNSEVRV